MQTLQISSLLCFLSRRPAQRGSGARPEGSAEWDTPLHPTGVCQWEPWLGQHPHAQDSRGLLQSVGWWLFQLLGEESLCVIANLFLEFISFLLHTLTFCLLLVNSVVQCASTLVEILKLLELFEHWLCLNNVPENFSGNIWQFKVWLGATEAILGYRNWTFIRWQ